MRETRPRRSALPTLIVTLLALLCVLAVLVFTGRHHKPSAFGLQLDTPVVTVTAGDTITTTVTVRARGDFRGTVTLSTANLPAGLVAEFDPPTVTVTDAHPVATAVLRLHTTTSLPVGAIGVGVVATGASGQTQTSVVQLQVQSDGSIGTAPAPVPTPGASSFTLTGSPTGTLSPGVRLPIDVHLDNLSANSVTVATIRVSIADTTRPACGLANFRVTQFGGHYPLVLPARSKNTLSSLSISPAQWPTLAMLNLPVNQDACKGVVVQLRFAGAGT